MTEANSLEPCPFCGGWAAIAVVPEARDAPRWYYLRCPECLSETKGDKDREAAIAAWNRRAPSPLDEGVRERVARIVDPQAFTPGTYEYDMGRETRQPAANAKADAILALISRGGE